ncbi:hypothetical protein [Pseudomonas savastanoi]|uniref:hypothetical protein n=1 Tax=Pseudomonas savastanoi TaxID=29438 RepID=UPI00177CACE3|nr:hypothetical protein [Pseudomonas savastanoi]QOI07905.1 hypothetical protein D5S10_29725 [Pseudomonas savastanoi]
MSDIRAVVEAVNTVIKAGREESQSWEKERSKYDRVLVGQRVIVVDRHDRTFRQGAEQYSLQRSNHDLSGVSHMTQENAEKVVKSLSESSADAGPYRAVDFQTYADERAREARGVVITAMRAKDLLIAPFMNEASFKMWFDESTSAWHDHRESGVEPEKESEHYTHAQAVLAAAPFEMKPNGKVVPKDGASVIYGPPLQPAHAEALAVFRSVHGDAWQEKLGEQWQKSAYPGMSENHSAALQQLRNQHGPEWLSQVTEPRKPELADIAAGNYIVVEITNTANAAFVDAGRSNEVGRLVKDASDIARSFPDDLMSGKGNGDINVLLFDVNGNSVGGIRHAKQALTDDPVPGAVRLVIDLSNDAFVGNASGEIGRILDDAAAKLQDGLRDFSLHDINGQPVGASQWPTEPSRVIDGKVDLRAEMKSGNFYKADDGFSGIADGEYRYVVADYEVGYGAGEGPVYLVNAEGEVAPGYDSPQVVSEKLFGEVPRAEATAVSEVVIGDVTLAEHERRYSGDEPELG